MLIVQKWWKQHFFVMKMKQFELCNDAASIIISSLSAFNDSTVPLHFKEGECHLFLEMFRSYASQMTQILISLTVVSNQAHI